MATLIERPNIHEQFQRAFHRSTQLYPALLDYSNDHVAWQNAVFMMASGNTPGESLGAQVGKGGIFNETRLAYALVEGALNQIHPNGNTDKETVSIALATAVIWFTDRKSSREVEQTMIDTILSHLTSNTEASAAYLADIADRVSEGMDFFQFEATKQSDTLKKKEVRIQFLSSILHRMYENVPAFEQPLLEAFIRSATHHHQEIPYALKDVYLTAFDRDRNYALEKTDEVHVRTWKRSMLHLLIEPTKTLTFDEALYGIYQPVLFELRHNEEYARKELVDAMIAHANEQRVDPVKIAKDLNSFGWFKYNIIAPLLLRNSTPSVETDTVVQALLQRGDTEIDLEIARLYAIWEKKEKVDSTTVLGLVDMLKKQHSGAIGFQLLRYIPREMTFNGALTLLERGFASGDTDASAGLVTAVREWVYADEPIDWDRIREFMRQHKDSIQSDHAESINAWMAKLSESLLTG